MMGLKSSIYWLTWFITGVTFIILSTIILIASGMACQFDVFLNSNIFAIFLLFFLFGLAMMSIAFMLTTIISRSSTAQASRMSFRILLGVDIRICNSPYRLRISINFVQWKRYFGGLSLLRRYSCLGSFSSMGYLILRLP